MEKLGFTVDFENDLITTSRTGERLKAERTINDHIALPFVPFAIEESVLVVENASRT